MSTHKNTSLINTGPFTSGRKWFSVLLIITILFLSFPVTSATASPPLKCTTLIKTLSRLQPDSPKYDLVWNLIQTNCGYEIDHAALLALYNSTDGANWTTPWTNLTSDHCNGWPGILCNEYGRVLDVTQVDNNLNGFIPPEFAYMIDLQSLYLPGNPLSGQIPSQLGNLPKLRTLGLFNTQLSGSIPPELGNLANLTWINLSYNQLSGSIPDTFGALANLETLMLTGNGLTGELPVGLGGLTRLTMIDLAGNQLNGSIPPGLGNLASLTKLNLASNPLTGPIPPELGNMTSLEWLTLDNTLVSGDIPAELSNLTNLWLLWLSSPYLGCWETPEALAWAIALTDYQGPGCCVP